MLKKLMNVSAEQNSRRSWWENKIEACQKNGIQDPERMQGIGLQEDPRPYEVPRLVLYFLLNTVFD